MFTFLFVLKSDLSLGILNIIDGPLWFCLFSQETDPSVASGIAFCMEGVRILT